MRTHFRVDTRLPERSALLMAFLDIVFVMRADAGQCLRFLLALDGYFTVEKCSYCGTCFLEEHTGCCLLKYALAFITRGTAEGLQPKRFLLWLRRSG
jgi:hypothetical protein